jgi:RNA polymerase sigma-70 factor (ECF subfamily)
MARSGRAASISGSGTGASAVEKMEMSGLTDAELVEQALAGSHDAAGELFRRYWLSSWRAAFAVTGRRAAADDVAQEAFQRAFGALSRFDSRRPFGAWLHRIVVNRALDVVRSERRLVPLDQRENGVGGSLDEQVRDEDVLAALARLDPGRRAVVALRYWLDYSPAEIADLLELPVGTVSSRLSRALAELRTELEANHV